ncbi:MAG TPA: hypothetical protein VMW45_03440 [Dehalococcoidia bacterium]|nr:hypothetical protein [Dehalococcoidia bacterium]
MKLNTMIFELYKGKCGKLPELAQTMGILVGHIYRVRQSRSSINEKFIIGAIEAFPGLTFSMLAQREARMTTNNRNDLGNMLKQ